MAALLSRVLFLELQILRLKATHAAELARKDQEILGLMDDRADACRRYASLLHECEVVES